MTEEREKAREPVVHEKTGAIMTTSAVTAELSVKRGLNDTRLAVLGILVTIGLTFGFGVGGWWGLAAGLSAFIVACALVRWEWSAQWLMRFMHWLTGH